MLKNLFVKNISWLQKLRHFLAWFGLIFLPARTASAQGSSYPQHIDTIGDIIQLVDAIVSDLIPIAASLALLAFFWGLAKYIFRAGQEDADQGKDIMIAGVIALFLIAAVGGIVQLLASTIGIENPGTNPIEYPSVAPSSG